MFIDATRGFYNDHPLGLTEDPITNEEFVDLVNRKYKKGKYKDE